MEERRLLNMTLELELLENSRKVSEIDLLDQQSKKVDEIDLLYPKDSTPAPKVPVEPVVDDKSNVFDKDIYSGHLTGNIMAHKFNLQRGEIGWNDETLHTATKNALVDVAKTQGMNVVATGELAMNLASSMLLYIPSKIYGTMALPFGAEVAKMAEEEIGRLGYQPLSEKGKQSAEMIGKGFEIFLTPAREIGEEVSKLSPELGYLVEFGAELAEFAMTGGIAKGVKAKFKPKIAEARKIIETKRRMEQEALDQQIAEVEGIPDTLIRETQKKVLEAEKSQAELRYKETVAKFEKGLSPLVAEELGRKGEEVARIKSRPIKDSGLKMGKVEGGEGPIADSWSGKEVKVKEEPKTIKSFKELDEPTTELDLQTGTPEPVELKGDSSPFREMNKKSTSAMKKVYAENKHIGEDPELIVGKSLNDVNLWLDGENVDIGVARDNLSNLAVAAKESGNRLAMLDYFAGDSAQVNHFVDMVSEAATWARGVGRKGGKTKLYSGVDPSLIKKLFKGFHGTSTKYIKPSEIVGKHLEPKTLKQIVEDVLSELELTGKDKDIARQTIYEYDYFDYSIKKGEGSRPFDEVGEVYAAKEYADAKEYSEWAGEAYDNALIALGAFDRPGGKFNAKVPRHIVTKAKNALDINRKAMPIVLEIEAPINFKLGDNISNKPVKVTAVYDSKKGTKLYDITGAVGEGAKEIVKGAKKVAEYTKAAKGMKAFKPKLAAKMIKEELVRSGIDRSGNIRKKMLDQLGDAGYKVVQKMYLSKGASSKAANMLKQMQKEVYRGLSKHEKGVLDNLILSDRMIDIGRYKSEKQFKFPEEIKPTHSIAYKELFEQIEKLSPEKAESLRNRAIAYFDWMKKPLQEMLDSGLITENEFKALSSHNYRRLKLVDIYDKKYQAKIGKKQRTVYDSGIEALSKGRDTDIFEPSSEIMALEVFNRAYGRILNNEANKALLEVARNNPENPFVRVKENKTDKIPTGWNRLFMYEKGERKAIYISPEMGKEWITNNPEMSYKMSQMLRVMSGSPVLRTFATGINWGFALANLPRDIMHTWFAARSFQDGEFKPIYNANMPVYAAQMGRDLATVFSDSVGRKGRYQDYINEGGGMEFMVHQGRLLQRGRHLEGGVDKLQNFMGYFGETSEVLTRLAIRERALRKGKSPQEATFIARDYMDFGQGGSIAKVLDNGIPYLNAAIQGTRGLFRAFKDNPISSTYKLSQFAALTTGLYIAMHKTSPESAKALQGNMAMQNNICIPLGDSFSFVDEEGQTRYPYFKIPLDPGQKFFKTFFEASTDKWLGNEVDVNRVVDSLKEQSPVGVTELPPSVSGILGYVTNKDFWMNEDIWRSSEPFSYPNSKEEYTSRTPQAYVDLGEKTGLSPERTKYMIEELTTGGTVWSYLLGQGYDAAFGDLPKENKEQHLAETLARLPISKRFIGITNPYSKHGQKIDEAQEVAVLKTFVQNRDFDIQVEGYLYGTGVERKDVVKNARQYKNKDVYDRLMDRFKFEEAIKTLPEKSFWRRMKGLRMEAKAKVFADRLKGSDEVEKKQLWKEYGIVSRAKGIISPEFRSEVRKQFSKDD